jgi:hypothetical protein
MKTLEQLSDLRARLVRAQRLENAAIRKMSAFSAKGGDKATFQRLLDDVHRARMASVALYEQWNAAVQVTQPTDEADGSEPVAPTRRDIGDRTSSC